MGAAEETKAIKRIFLFGVLPLVITGAVIGKMMMTQQAVSKDIEEKVSKVRRFYDQGFNVPDAESIQKKQQTLAEAAEKVRSLAANASFLLPEVPNEIPEHGVYFKEKLYLTHRELSSLGTKMGVEVPGNIGFTEKLPQKNEVPGLLLKLNLVDKVLRILIDNKAKKIHLVEFLESATLKNGQEEDMPVKNISARMDVTCSLGALQKTLYEIGNLNPFVLVEGLSIKQNPNNLLEVTLQLTQLLYEEEKKNG